MRRLFPQMLFAVVLGFLSTFAVPLAHAQGPCPSGLYSGLSGNHCYFIAANGSDANNGTSESSPWLHAPGMVNCAGKCAAVSPSGAEGFIFRGGDTWHFENSSPSSGVYTGGCSLYVSSCWQWQWSGSSSSCQLNAYTGAVTRSSCMYIGVDQNWYAGPSWARPVFTGDNPLSTGFVSACGYLNDNTNFIIAQAKYVIFDNLEFVGNCSGSNPNAAFITPFSSPLEISNSYFHGWTVTSSGNAGGYSEIGFAAGNSGFLLFDHNVMDGSDSSGASTPYTGTEKGMNYCPDVEFNVIRYVSNFCVDGTNGSPAMVYHDNLFEYLYNPAAGHGNVVELGGGNGNPTGGPVFVYNNVYRHSDEGVSFDIGPNNGGYVYVFNNVVYDVANGGNCFSMMNPTDGSTNTMYVFNNTWDFQTNVQGNTNGGCQVRQTGSASGIVVNFQNNHFINYSLSSISAVMNGSGGKFSDSGNEVWQSESTANGQGYTSSNAYQPTSSSSGTYHAGANLSSSCSASNALCSGSTGGMTMNPNAIAALLIALPPERATTWDAGAYQYSGSSSSQVNPPTGLAAIVQ